MAEDSSTSFHLLDERIQLIYNRFGTVLAMPHIQLPFTVLPIWLWGGAGLLASVIAFYFLRAPLSLIVTGIWAFPSFTTDCAFNWDIAVEPGATTKATHYFANGLAISADSKNAEAAYKWIEFLATSEQVAQLRVQLGWELPCATYQTAMDQYAKLTPPANRQAVFDSLDYVVPVPQIAQFSQMADILGAELEAAANGTKTPQQALDDAQAELEAAITLG